MSDIFISYARADRKKAELLASVFSRRGWSVWWDRQIPPGQAFDETIEEALSAARCVIVLWSAHSVNSRWVKTEAAEGAARGILVPVLIENVKIPLEFRRIEAADLSQWPNDVSDAEFDQLLRSVGSLIDGNPAVRRNRIPMELGDPSTRRWNPVSILGGLLGGVILSLGVLYQAGWLGGHPPSLRNDAHSPGSAPASGKSGREPESAKAPSASARLFQRSDINLLSTENGGHVVVATNDQWRHAIDGDEKNWQYVDIGVTGAWAVYGFKDGSRARFNTFRILIAGSESWNLNEFELLAGNDSPTGKFDSIGRFQTQNARFFKDAYQEFKFPPVQARYLKVRVISSHGFSSVGVHEFQLIGRLE